MRKVDWIAEHGGMVLLDTHPDYMNFGEARKTGGAYPVGLYAELLEYLRSKYRDQYWHALPREVAKYVSQPALTDGDGGIKSGSSAATISESPIPSAGIDGRLDSVLSLQKKADSVKLKGDSSDSGERSRLSRKACRGPVVFLLSRRPKTSPCHRSSRLRGSKR